MKLFFSEKSIKLSLMATKHLHTRTHVHRIFTIVRECGAPGNRFLMEAENELKKPANGINCVLCRQLRRWKRGEEHLLASFSRSVLGNAIKAKALYSP